MDELVIPNNAVHDVASYEILVNGTPADPTFQVLSIHVIKEVNRIPIAKIIFRDGDASERDFALSNEDVFMPGRQIQINIGRDGNNTQAFKGIITRHAIKMKENGNGELHIECRDETIRMTVGRHNKYFENVKDNRIFDELIGGYKNLKSDAVETKLTHREMVQHHISDWDFLLMRAEANAMLVNVSDGVVTIAAPDTSKDPVLQVAYGSSVLEFEAEMDARNQWKNVKASSWDYANQKLFQADTAEASDFSQHGNITGNQLAEAIGLPDYEMRHSGHVLEQELKDWTESVMLKSRLAKIRGRAKFTGFSGIKPGDMVKLEGVGNRFKGKAFVTGVKQEMGNGIWDTHIQFGLDPTQYASTHPDIPDAPAAGLTAGVHGLQIGVVVQLQNDPDGEDRIRVKIPVIDNNGQGIWTRIASLDAGADRGAFFRPEIGDEVIVGFINDDPRDAIVLGMLNSSAKPAPLTAQDVNHEKGFTTRSKMHLLFNDDKKTITIDTPAGNSITIDEQGMKIQIKDQNSNTITMDASGIKIESPKNVEIKAGVNLTLAATASLSIGGASLGVKADGNLTMEGALAKLSAQGIAEISGSLVKIN
jgi:Rhs element Vgr protein